MSDAEHSSQEHEEERQVIELPQTAAEDQAESSPESEAHDQPSAQVSEEPSISSQPTVSLNTDKATSRESTPTSGPATAVSIQTDEPLPPKNISKEISSAVITEPEQVVPTAAAAAPQHLSIESVLGLAMSAGIPIPPAAMQSNTQDSVSDSAPFFVDNGTPQQRYNADNGYDPTTAAAEDMTGRKRRRGRSDNDGSAREYTIEDLSVPFTREEEENYDQFVKYEKDCVTRAEWDRFPQGSRLFIGNLSTDSLEKAHLYKIFAKFGKLAQISMKQSYGFVQFENAEDCARAIAAEQGSIVNGRKLRKLSFLSSLGCAGG